MKPLGKKNGTPLPGLPKRPTDINEILKVGPALAGDIGKILKKQAGGVVHFGLVFWTGEQWAYFASVDDEALLVQLETAVETLESKLNTQVPQPPK